MERKFGQRATTSRRSSDGNREVRKSTRSYGEKPAGRKFGEKPYGDKPERGSKFGRKPFEHKDDDSAERKFGRKPYGEKPAGRKFGEKPYSDKPERGSRFSRKPYGEKSYDEKPLRRGRGFRKEEKMTEEPAAAPSEVRLNKFIANSGVCSRREADTFIQTGLVTVNGKIVTELGSKVKPTDDIRFNGERLRGERKVYILMNKPKDFVTTMADPHADRTVMDLISKDKCPERVYPVGRLDKATTGVLLFTNDGEMTEKLTHPSHNVKKIYQVTLEQPLAKEDFDKILEGIELEDGPIAADTLAYVGDDKTEIGIEIHSGRNRIVRRIFESLNYRVKKLDRVYFAGLTKKNVRRGEWRFLEEKEVNLLKMGAVE